MSEKATYAAAGVDVKEGARAVELMKKHVKETYNGNVLGDLGNFGGLLRLSGEFQNPVLVAGTDGVGTKLKLAFMMDRHDTVGQDLVAMCVNDILCQGATPLFFLDYMATGKLQAEKAAEIVSGIAKACKLSQMPLLGGETAEMPGFYSDGEYDLAGFAVGVVDEKHVVTGKDIKPGDLLIGLESSGIHSNGYSLVRHVIFDKMGFSPETVVDELGGKVGDQLLTPTRIYVSSILKLLEKRWVKGAIHMTGGGFYENIPRILPEGTGVEIYLERWTPHPIFKLIQKSGEIERDEMFATFNMGIGFIVVVDPNHADFVLDSLKESGEVPHTIGQVINGHGEVVLCNA
ncbi:phosphoribosylformylglycinamidine cyclo-ligase [Fusibacter tunisiensis]|uniref:Phosphoribosylformylglycinamidine cyclo-ligase n=1 Tax=Fusibacter tunisiensis TaxID=1008308 RepID=A0ABS2MSH2_9FIRM|nr:phosphoribosylformylglycinamidine cyclo-ligase [Fusibacter tunisiensis]MBM7562342.1 phosphoribosylformylglycinamidine cyclo-ligase [Fusibacter tunisiensis]